MKKIFNSLKKISLRVLLIYVSLCFFVILTDITSDIGVKKTVNGVTNRLDSNEASQLIWGGGQWGGNIDATFDSSKRWKEASKK